MVMKKNEVIKHSAAIQISNVVNLLQRRAWNILLANAFDDLDKWDEFEIPIKKLCSILKYDSRNDKHLKQLLRELIDIKVEWNVLNKDNSEWGVAVLLAQAQIINGVLVYGYAPILRKRLHNPAMYAKINLSLQNNFDSKHTLALYEMCVDYFNINTDKGFTPYIKISDFRKLLGLNNNEYKIFGDLNKWVIKKAINEINKKSDIHVKIEYQKDKRKIVGIRFIVCKNENNPYKDKDKKIEISDNSQPLLLTDLKIDNQELFEKLINEFGVSQNKAIEILTTTDEFYIYEVLQAVQNQIKKGNIRNVAAFTVKAIEKDYRSKKDRYQMEEEEKLRKKEKKKNNNMMIDKMKDEFENQLKDKIKNVLECTKPEDKKRLEEEFVDKKVKNNEFVMSEYKKRGINGIMMCAMFNQFVAEKYIKEEERNFDLYLKNIDKGMPDTKIKEVQKK